MNKIGIRRAETEADFDAARVLALEWGTSHREDFREHRAIVDTVFEPVAYAKTIETLHIIHAGPKGAILLAELDGAPVGCGMYQEMEPGVAEIKRLYVSPKGRGHGLGQALLQEMFVQMRAVGYTSVRFSSAKVLTHARAVYEQAGFQDIDTPDDLPEFLRGFVFFMERPL